jgi:ribosomal protein S18 acetylase RimI-like enzyme
MELIRVYKCTPEYLADVVRISNESYKKQRTAEDFKKYIDTFGKFFYVLTVNGDAKGFVLVDDNYLKMIAVEKRSRKKGYGKKLMNFILGCTSGLKTRVRASNSEAIQFYEHFGFVGFGKIHSYYSNGEDAFDLIFGKIRTYN